MAEAQNTNGQEQDINQLLQVRRDKLAVLQEAGKDPFQITRYDVTHHSTDIKENYGELEGKSVRIAGRIMSKRVMGKASFCNVQDLPGNIQCYVARDSIGEESYADFKKYDVGDIVGVEGEVFTTKTGEISVHASAVILQEPADSAGEVSRTDQYGHSLSAALYGSDHERRCEGDLREALPDHQCHSPLSGKGGLSGGGNSHAGAQCRRRCGTAL